MIFFISDGRLGNEVFQYAFLKTQAKKNERIIALKMDNFLSIMDVENEKLYCPKLSKFTIFFTMKILVRVLSFLVKFKVISSLEQSKSNGFFIESIEKKKGFLPFTFVKTGFYQSEKMFNKEVLDFRLKEEYVRKAGEILNEIGNYDFVFVHVRRGDYLYESFNGSRGIDLPKEYFLRAIKEVSIGLHNPFYIFLTDDHNCTECFFNDLKNKYISKENMAVDLALMASCQYGVTSNSSFSWWGAYLMTDKKKVVYPKYWYGWKSKIESHPGIQPSWGAIIEPID